MLRAVAATRSPRSRAASVHSRPNPRDVPVMNQVLLLTCAPRLCPVRRSGAGTSPQGARRGHVSRGGPGGAQVWSRRRTCGALGRARCRQQARTRWRSRRKEISGSVRGLRSGAGWCGVVGWGRVGVGVGCGGGVRWGWWSRQPGRLLVAARPAWCWCCWSRGGPAGGFLGVVAGLAEALGVRGAGGSAGPGGVGGGRRAGSGRCTRGCGSAGRAGSRTGAAVR